MYQITDDVLYLTESWHFDTETSQYKNYTVNGNSISWSNWGIGDLTVKFTPTDGGNNWGVVEASEFVFLDINETITLNSLSADAFEYGAQVASVATTDVDFSTVGTTSSFLRIVDGALALESGSYYNPNSDRVIRPDNTYYDLSGGETTAGIVLYDDNDKVVAYESIILTDTLFSNVSPANTPYYAGSSTATASQSSDLYIKSLLYENPVVWKTDAVNEQYQTDAEETVITYSFSGINGTTGDYTADYSLPNPNSDTIFPFADHHMAATRLALNEFENVANLKFVEIQETEDQVGTLRFAFTDAENLLDNGTQAGGWASAPWPNAPGGDVWMHTEEAPDDTTWDRGSSYKFSTLLHEIGHALGLTTHLRIHISFQLALILQTIHSCLTRILRMPGGTLIGLTADLIHFHQHPWFMISLRFSIYMVQRAIMKQILNIHTTSELLSLRRSGILAGMILLILESLVQTLKFH